MIVINVVVINIDGFVKVVGKGKDVYFFFCWFLCFFGFYLSSIFKILDIERK